jgi:uncharacterized protein (UPF0335 family)
MTSSQLDHILNEIINRLERLEKAASSVDAHQIDRVWAEIQRLHALVRR